MRREWSAGRRRSVRWERQAEWMSTPELQQAPPQPPQMLPSWVQPCDLQITDIKEYKQMTWVKYFIEYFRDMVIFKWLPSQEQSWWKGPKQAAQKIRCGITCCSWTPANIYAPGPSANIGTFHHRHKTLYSMYVPQCQLGRISFGDLHCRASMKTMLKCSFLRTCKLVKGILNICLN